MYKDKKIIHLVARDSKGGIGRDNSLMWNIPEDMKFFRESTLGNVCLVGRKTAESFPKPLSRRVVVEVTRNNRSDVVSTTRTLLLSDFLRHTKQMCEVVNTDKILIIGGEMLYNTTFDIADELWVTEVIGDFGADKHYYIPEGFHKFEFTDVLESVSGDKYQFTKYLRNPPF